VRTNYDPEEDTAHNSVFQQYESYCVSEDFHTIRNYVTKNWNEFPVFHDLPVLSEYYAAKNYHHFKVRFLPQVRRYADSAETQIGVPDELLALPFQRELIGRTYGSRNILPLPIVFRVVNPILSYDPISSDGVAWLREHVGLRAERGRRRIYIRRGGSLVGRRGGGVVETPEFLAFLARHNFETISFGGGELPIAEQVALLNGAGIVMSAHGASLTNIAYLDPGVSIIEIFGKHWCHHSHIQLAMHVGLRHSGVISEIDDQLNLRVDMRRLEAAFERSLQA
jgi:capsular polysaccharide biosynthesis protein